LLLVNVTVAPPVGAAAFKVTVADEEVPAAIEFEGTFTAWTAVALGVAVPEPDDPVPEPDDPEELPVEAEPPLPDTAGEAENPLLAAAPQPIKIASARSIATAMPSEPVRNFSLDSLAYVAGRQFPKAALFAVNCSRLPTDGVSMFLASELAPSILPITAP
jgi:hypothetical protein